MSVVNKEKEQNAILEELIADCRHLVLEQRPNEALYLLREHLTRGALAPECLRGVGRSLLTQGSPELAAVLFEAVLAHIETGDSEDNETEEQSIWPTCSDAENEEFDPLDLEYVTEEETGRRAQRVYEPGFQVVLKTGEEPAIPGRADHTVLGNEGPQRFAFSSDDDAEPSEVEQSEDLGDLLDDGDWLDEWEVEDDEVEESLCELALDTADWDIFVEDVLDFEEAPSREELEEVRTTGRLSKEERAREAALKMGLANGWDESQILTLQRIFLAYPWAATRTAVQRLIDRGAGPEDLALAHDLRMIWRENPEYSASFGLYAHEVLSWPLAISVINSFRGYPAPEELENLLHELYTDWYGSVSCRRNFISFRDYLKVRVENSLNDQLCTAGVDWTDGVPETAWEPESAIYSGSNTPVLMDLSGFDLLPQPGENIYQRVGGIDWNRYEGVAGWASPENYFSRLKKK